MILTALLSFFIATASANPVCGSLFEPKPTHLVVADLKQKIINGENLDTHQEHVVYLQNILRNLSDSKTTSIAEIAKVLDLEVAARISEKKMTYHWIWTISLRTMLLKEKSDGHDPKNPINKKLFVDPQAGLSDQEIRYKLLNDINDSGRNVRSLIDLMRRETDGQNDIFLPVIGHQPFEAFLEVENSGVNFIGFIFSPLAFDGQPGSSDYLEFTRHDADHVRAMMESRKKAGPLWPEIHNLIFARIKNLSGNEKRFTIFFYWYLLHENELFREKIVTAVTKNKISAFKKSLTGEDTAENIFKEIFIQRLNDPVDFGQDFKDIPRKEVIYKIAKKAFLDILKEVQRGAP